MGIPRRSITGISGSGPAAHIREGWRGNALPQLNLLRTFEAAAWHESFTAASQELAITQSAVSQQIRQLEETIGLRLFERLPQRVRLTTAGAIYADTIREALGIIARASNRVVAASDQQALTVLVSPSFANRWLIPRLDRFRKRHPDIQVTILSMPDPVDLGRQRIDLAVRWGNGRWPGAPLHYLGDQRIVPVCSPGYLAGRPPIRNALELSRQTLLHLTRDNHWGALFEALGVSPAPEADTIFFSDTSPMLEACVQGHGIGLSSILLADADLRAGRLVVAFQAEINVGHGFYVLSRESSEEKPASHIFRKWLTMEYEDTLAHAPGFATTLHR